MELRLRNHPSDGAKMVLVPAGPFAMGCPDDDIFAKDHEKPERMVFLSAYWIDIYPVTNARYKRFMDDGGYELHEYWTPEGWEWKEREGITAPLAWNRPGWDAPNQPVAGVSWYEATAYARWSGKSLPTEAQWEKAARGNDRRKFPWGDTFPNPDLANFDGRVGHVTPVSQYPAGKSPFGCFDMSGNVNNWCRDWYWPGFYRYCLEMDLFNDPCLDDSVCQAAGVETNLKCDRGGGFATSVEAMEVLSCTDKVAWEPQTRELWNGFRTVAAAR